MLLYSFRRLCLIVPTLLGIMLLNFLIIQIVPGGPVEQVLARLQGLEGGTTARISSTGSDMTSAGSSVSFSKGDSQYHGARGISPEIVERIERQFGFDKPAPARFFHMLKSYIQFDFGESFYRDRKVTDLLLEKMPVSISLGFWTTLLIYLISIPMGIQKAVRDGSIFDIWSSFVVIIGNAVPSFLFAILLIILFSGGQYFSWFPLRGLVSDNFADLSLLGKVVDYFWHITLPVLSMVIGGFAGLTMLTKNSFIEEINKQYVMTARAKGLAERTVLYGHVFRNAMLVVVAGFPSALVGIFFTGSLLTEIIFSLDGLGLLGFEAIIQRDYPVVFATLYIFTLVGLLLNLIGDLLYHIIDPRIDFESRKV